MKIGITQRGDAGKDLSWTDKLKNVDGAIIISKNLTQQLHKALIENKLKIIFHYTITGLGGTIIEPNVPVYTDSVFKLKKLINDGFPVNHIVVRIDPLIGTYLFSQIQNYPIENKDNLHIQSFYFSIIENIIESTAKLGIRRYRYSYLDLYPHVKQRFVNAGFKVPRHAMSLTADYKIQTKNDIDYFQQLVRGISNDISYKDANGYDNCRLVNYLANHEPTIFFESCAEKFVPEQHRVGCISKNDFKILGLDENKCIGSSNQRKLCLCPCCKTELLNNKYRCEHSCLYCYWKDIQECLKLFAD